MTPMDTSLFISFISVALYILLYRAWPAMLWLALFLSSVEMGGWFQSPYVPFRAAHIWGAMRVASLDAMGLGEDNNCPSFLAGYSVLSCLVPNITSLLLVVSSSIWFKAKQLYLSKSPSRYAKFDVQMIELLLGGGYYLWLWVFFEIHTAPGSCKLTCQWSGLHRCLSLASYSTVLRAYYCLFLLIILTKEMLISPTSFV